MSWSQEKYNSALQFAAIAHKDQKVPGKPYSYVVHLSSVCMEVLGAVHNSIVENPDLAVQCALLHDVIEDTDTKESEFKEKFDISIYNGVKALTKNDTLPKEEKMQDSLNRIKNEPKEIGLVKMADRITNLQKPPSYWSKDKRQKYLEEAKVILDNLGYCNEYLSKRLQNKIEEYKNFIE